MLWILRSLYGNCEPIPCVGEFHLIPSCTVTLKHDILAYGGQQLKEGAQFVVKRIYPDGDVCMTTGVIVRKKDLGKLDTAVVAWR